MSNGQDQDAQQAVGQKKSPLANHHQVFQWSIDEETGHVRIHILYLPIYAYILHDYVHVYMTTKYVHYRHTCLAMYVYIYIYTRATT